MSDPYVPQTTTATQSGLSDNVAAGLAYLVSILAIVWLFLDPYKLRPFVRFASFQVIFLAVTYIAAAILYGVLMFIPGLRTIGSIVMGLVFLALGICYFIAMIMAFMGKKFVVPGIGPLAEKYSSQ